FLRIFGKGVGTKAAQGRGGACIGDGCWNVENLNARTPLRMGTGAIRQEFFINSRLSAPQTPGWKPFVCPIRRSIRTLRFSHIPADVSDTRTTSALVCFLV